MTPLPPASGRCFSPRTAAAAFLLALILPCCHGSDTNENRIKPIMADLVIAPFPSTDPSIFMEKVSQQGDLAVVDVKLHTTAPITFDAFSMEFHFDPALVQVGDAFDVNPAILGDCHGGAVCAPLCSSNVQAANGTGKLLLGVARNAINDPPGSPQPPCPQAQVAADTTLLTLGFVAASTGTSTIQLYTDPISTIHGDCEILQYGSGSNPVVDLGIICYGTATLTATR